MKNIYSFLPFEPSSEQKLVLDNLSEFIHSNRENELFILRGYAGTGKTSLMGAAIKFMDANETKNVLMAPTGRAAKVLASGAGKAAYTVHKMIYHTGADENSGPVFQLQHNAHTQTIFVVDEASMLGESPAEARQQFHLLDDLLQFVYSGHECKLILLGDDAQLPPVGLDHSYSLFGEYYKRRFSLRVIENVLTGVMRQKSDSAILHNATAIRSALDAPESFSGLDLDLQKDVSRVPPSELTEAVEASFRKFGRAQTIVITRSNKRANQINSHIRNAVFQYEDEIASGDLLMVVKNNYYWLDNKHSAGFIANGDFAEVVRVRAKEEKYGFRFARVLLKFTDYPDDDERECLVLLDTLQSSASGLDNEKQKQFFMNLQAAYADIPSQERKYAAIKKDPYFNALHIKYGYAVTCHKSQGGQWEQVFLDTYGWFDPQPSKEYLRWMYTAVTRASGSLFVLANTPH
jgi:exodeoxyribonuclease-5